jgi:hypothetical protein
MATPDEIIQAASDIAAAGVAESQVADRREKYLTPAQILEAADAVAAANLTRGPFIRVGFRGRPV